MKGHTTKNACPVCGRMKDSRASKCRTCFATDDSAHVEFLRLNIDVLSWERIAKELAINVSSLRSMARRHRIAKSPEAAREAIRRGRWPQTLQERFWGSVRKTESCWEWTGRRNRNGYGTLSISRKPALAHRLSFEMKFGPFARSLCVLHKCDNPPCVNPDHLFLGTRADNMADMNAKGRHWTKKRASA